MNAFRTIVFAADFSENSREAFSVACSLSREDKTRLVVLAVAKSDWVADDPVCLGQSSVAFHKKAPTSAVSNCSSRSCEMFTHPLTRSRSNITHEKVKSLRRSSPWPARSGPT